MEEDGDERRGVSGRRCCRCGVRSRRRTVAAAAGAVDGTVSRAFLGTMTEFWRRATEQWMHAVHVGRAADWLTTFFREDVGYTLAPPPAGLKLPHTVRMVVRGVPYFQGHRLSKFIDAMFHGRIVRFAAQRLHLSMNEKGSMTVKVCMNMEIRLQEIGRTYESPARGSLRALMDTITFSFSPDDFRIAHVHYEPVWQEYIAQHASADGDEDGQVRMAKRFIHDGDLPPELLDEREPSAATVVPVPPPQPEPQQRGPTKPPAQAQAAPQEQVQQQQPAPGGSGGERVATQPVCDHNNWDMARAKRGWAVLKCRTCASQWRVAIGVAPGAERRSTSHWASELSAVQFCAAFRASGSCAAGTGCPMPHVHRNKHKGREAEDAEAPPPLLAPQTPPASPRQPAPPPEPEPEPEPAGAAAAGAGAGPPVPRYPAGGGPVAVVAWYFVQWAPRFEQYDAEFAVQRQPRTDWVPDRLASACMRCGAAFTLTARRHHCRGCGEVLCARCTQQRGVAQGHRAPQRVCDTCKQAPLRLRQSLWKLPAPIARRLAAGELHLGDLDAALLLPQDV